MLNILQNIAREKKTGLKGSKKSRNRASQVSDSEIITILICFHLGVNSCYKEYYLQIIKEHYGHLFLNLLSFNRFIELQSKVAVEFMLFLKECRLGKCTGISFIDSTLIKVCKNQRILWHKTFKEVAQRSKTSMG